MNRQDLVSAIAARLTGHGIKKQDIDKILGAAIAEMSDSLTIGERVSLVGFGTFTTKQRKARIGRNPQTGESLEIPAKNAVHFAPGKELRTRVA